MKERTPEQLKGQVRHFATQRGLQPQEVLQMFLLERVLERLRALWLNYQNSNKYAGSVDFDSTLATVEEISIKTNM
ncbi:MAG: hypothetical protein VZR24_14530 [Butyrivibrio hungatei]|nr:hypothetical protein [Butyrivibrio hungatei]